MSATDDVAPERPACQDCGNPVWRIGANPPLCHACLSMAVQSSGYKVGARYAMRRQRAFACKVDWDCHMPDDAKGVTFFGSMEDLRAGKRCIDGCGWVEVEIGVVDVGFGTNDEPGDGLDDEVLPTEPTP